MFTQNDSSHNNSLHEPKGEMSVSSRAFASTPRQARPTFPPQSTNANGKDHARKLLQGQLEDFAVESSYEKGEEDQLLAAPNQKQPAGASASNPQEVRSQFQFKPFSLPSGSTPVENSPTDTSVANLGCKRSVGDVSWEGDYPSFFQDLDSLEAGVREENDVVCTLAIHNYEVFYKMTQGSASLKMVQDSSAGVAGWAACIVDGPDPSRASETQEIKKSRVEQTMRPGDEEEAMQLRVALLRSVGVDVDYAPPQQTRDSIETPSQDDEEYGEYEEYEEEHEDFYCYDSHRNEWALQVTHDEEGEGKKEESEHTDSKLKPRSSTKDDCGDSVEQSGQASSDTGKDPGVNETVSQNGHHSEKQAEDTYDSRSHPSTRADGNREGQMEPNKPTPNAPVVSNQQDDKSQDGSQSSESYVLVCDENSDSSSRSGADDQRSSASTESDQDQNFVIVGSITPTVDRSSWQWRNLVQHLHDKAPPQPPQQDGSGDGASDASSGYDRCL